jgi:hypothetical protein
VIARLSDRASWAAAGQLKVVVVMPTTSAPMRLTVWTISPADRFSAWASTMAAG